MTFGENLRKRRLDLGMTQEQVARRLKVSAKSVGNWETDSSWPLMRQVLALRAILGDLPTPGEELASRLKSTRARLRLTANDLANLVGLDVRTVRACEIGRHCPTKRCRERLRDVLVPLTVPV